MSEYLEFWEDKRNSGFRERNREERGINKVKNIWAWGRMTDQGDRGSFGEVK